MKKRLLALLLAGVMVLALVTVPAAAQGVAVEVSAQGQAVGTLQFTLNDTNNTAQLDGAAPGITGMLTVPPSVSYQGKDYTVTTVGNQAFAGQTGLTQLWLPRTVTSIGNEAFMDCQQLLAVGSYGGQDDADPYALPEGMLVIGERTFRGCTRLGAVTIPASVQRIGAWAFAYCYSLERVTFAPRSYLNTINQGSFYSCISLEDLTLPQGLKSISLQAFSHCAYQDGNGVLHGLKTLVLPEGLTELGDEAFSYCGALESVTIPAGLKVLPQKAFYSCSALRTVDFTGDGLTAMGHSAFFWCTKLTTIRTGGRDGLPATLTSIPRWAFYRCDSLAEVDLSGMSALGEIEPYAFNTSGVVYLKLPQNLKYIRLLAFESCNKLESIDWNRPEVDEDLLTVEEKAFAKTGLKTVTVPQLYDGSGLEMFYDCDSLTTVTVDPKALFIPAGAFRDCDALTSVTLGDHIEKVGQQAFYSCPKLTNVDLADATSLKVIGPMAFCRTALPTVSLPASIQDIGLNAFGINRALTSIQVAEGNPGRYYSTDGVLYQNNPDVNGGSVLLVKYPAGKAGTTFAVPEGVTAIESYAFSHSEKLEEVTFPTSLRIIGYYALSHCINLTTADVPENVEQGDEIFEGSYHMTQVTLPPDLTKLTSSSLPVNSKIKTVTLPASVEEIDIVGPFSSLAFLEEILVDKDNTHFKSADGVLFSKDGTILYAYPRGKAGSEYVVPDGVTTIWYSAFSDVSSLTHLTLPASVTTVRSSACYNMSNLERLDILREMPDVNKNPNDTVAYNRFLTDVNPQLQVYVHGDPTDQAGVENWVQNFVTVCGEGNAPAKQNVHVDFYKPATQAGDRFLQDGVIYTLVDPDANTVKVGANTNYEGGSVLVPDQVLHQGTAYTVTDVEKESFPAGVEVIRSGDLSALTPGKTDLTYGDTLVVHAPASVSEGSLLTLAAGGKSLTKAVEGGAARFPVDKAMADAFGFKTTAVTVSGGGAETSFNLTLAKKIFTKQDLPWYNSSMQELVLEKPYDGTTTLDVTSSSLLRDFVANGETLSLHITGNVPSPSRSTAINTIGNLKLEFVGETAGCYDFASDVKGSVKAMVTYGQLYLKEVGGVLQQPTYRRVWAAEDGMRLMDCDLSGGMFVAYLPKVENNVITGYTEVEVKGKITYNEVNHYPGLASFDEIGVEQDQVYKWVFTPQDNGDLQSQLDNYRFFGTVKPWDTSLTQATAGSTGSTGENPPLPAYVRPEQEESPDLPTGGAGAVATAPGVSTPAPDVTPTPTPHVTPTPTPDVTPSTVPSTEPSATPSVAPSAVPSTAPSATPSVAPSATPSVAPSVAPSTAPSATPSVTPTATPSVTPSATPSVTPSATPSVAPSVAPSTAPSATPSVAPSAAPSVTPSATPSARPTPSLSYRPSGSSSASRPSAAPSATAPSSAAPSAAVLTDRPGGGKVLTLAQNAALTADQCRTLAAANAQQPVKLDTAQGLRVFVPAGTLHDQSQVAGLLADISLATDGAVVVRADDQGNRHILPMALVQKGQVAYVADQPGQYYLAIPQVDDFADTDSHWAKEAVAFTTARGLTRGMTQTTFEPEGSTSRAMVFTMLARLTGEELPASQGLWYDSAVNWAMAQGLSDGDRPESPVKRQELVTLLWRWAGKPHASADLTGFADVREIAPYAQESIAWAVKSGILTGRPDATIDPLAGATRAETAAILQRFITHQVNEQTR